MRVRAGGKVVIVPDDISDGDLNEILNFETGAHAPYSGKADLPLEEDVGTELALGGAFAGPAMRVLGAPASVAGRGAVAGGRLAGNVAKKAAPVVGKAVGKRLSQLGPPGVSIALWELLQKLRGKK